MGCFLETKVGDQNDGLHQQKTDQRIKLKGEIANVLNKSQTESNKYTPQKSNIDTKNDAMFEDCYLFQTIISVIHVSFRECNKGASPCHTSKISEVIRASPLLHITLNILRTLEQTF